MHVVRPLDQWSLHAPLWLIEVDHVEVEETSFLQAEGPDGTYLLVYSSASKAHDALVALNVSRGNPTCVSSDVEVELATAMCQVGARGILVDFDPTSQRAAWSRALVASA